MSESENIMSSSVLPHEAEFFIALSALELIFGVLLNSIVLCFFLQQPHKSNSRFIYICINSVDTVLCGTVLFQIADYISGEPGLLETNLSVCTLYSFAWVVCAKMSVFLVMVLSIARTISMVFPLKKIRRRKIVVPVLVYFLLMLVQNSITFWLGESYVYWKTGNFCVWSSDVFYQLTESRVFTEFLRHLLGTSQFAFPSLVVIICCSVSVARLKASLNLPQGVPQGRRRATVTMLYITAAFLTFNIPFVASAVIFTFDMAERKSVLLQYMTSAQSELLWKLMFHTHYFNSMANAIIYFIRVEGLREFVSGVPGKILNCDFRAVIRRSLSIG